MERKDPSDTASGRRGHALPRGAAIFLTLLTDFLLIGGGLCVFALFHHVLPRYFEAEPLYSEEDLQNGQGSFGLPGGTGQENGTHADSSAADSADAADSAALDDDGADSGLSSGDSGAGENASFPEQFLSYVASLKRYEESPLPPRESLPIGCYKGKNAMIAVVQHSFGEEDDRITYQAADLFVSTVTDLETYVFLDENGNVCDGSVEEAAGATNAVFAVNTDYFKSRSWGYYVRNGVKYLGSYTKNDVCVIYLDGSMEVLPGEQVRFEEIMKKGVWQMFTFGPSLFDENGKPYLSEDDMNITGTYNLAFNNTSFYGFQSPNPRTALGYVSPGHYVVVTVDGRQNGYSRGATLTELAQILYDEGCVLAYNLDGGGSTQMFFGGETANSPSSGRDPSDYLVIRDGGTLYRMEEDRWKEEDPS